MVFECVGRQEVLGVAVEACAPGGTVICVGNPHGDMTLPRQTYWKILRNELTLKGIWNSAYLGGISADTEAKDDWQMVLELMQEGRINPKMLISHRFPLKDLPKGLAIMRDKSEEYVKVMIVSEGENL